MDYQTILGIYRPLDWRVFTVVFAVSVIYTVVLQVWMRRWPESFADDTWVQVVGGTGYLLIAAAWLMGPEAWLRLCTLFFFGCLPIVGRSLYNRAVRRRQANELDELEEDLGL